jgi:hypothetical protein
VVHQRSAPLRADRRQLRWIPDQLTVCRYVLFIVLAYFVVGAFAQAFSQGDANSMRDKLSLIGETGNVRRDEGLPPVRTPVTDREINAYLTVYGPTFLPRGLTDPQIEIGSARRVTARGLVDLDAVRLSRQRDWLDPMNYMTGLLDFAATGVITCSNGIGVLSFESATLGGFAVPKSIVQELVRYYTTTPEWPNGFNIDEPVDLPANIQSIVLEPGRATIIQ